MSARVAVVFGCDEPGCTALAHGTAALSVGLFGSGGGGVLVDARVDAAGFGWTIVNTRAWCPAHKPPARTTKTGEQP